MRKQFLILCILFGIAQNMFAQTKQISLTEAVNAAVTRIAFQNNIDRSNISVTNVAFCENDNGDILLYEVATDMGQTVVLSGSRMCLPILGVHENEEGMLLNKIDSLPGGLQFLISWYKAQVNGSFQDTVMESSHVQEWYSLTTGDLNTVQRYGGVLPLLKSNWTQKSPNVGSSSIDAYNYLMPSGNGCNHCLAGCVAVAMGQVMYYWKYPVLKELYENQFDWCDMSDKLDTSSQTYSKNRDAISYLLLKCGEMVDMNYGCDGSGADTEDARDALVDYFDYKETARFKKKNDYSDVEWKGMLKSNLDRGMPVIYKGRSSLIGGSGHAFVCDGYDESGLFHFNWGWGRYNSYYTLDNLNPSGHEYTFWQAAIFDIEPSDDDSYCNFTLYLEDFYGFHSLHSHPIYTATPKTSTRLISASSSALSSWRTIPSGATAEYVAHKEVVLRPGFTAEYGCDFTVRIEPCSSCESRQEGEGLSQSEEEQITMRNTVVKQKGDVVENGVGRTRSSVVHVYPNPTNGSLTVTGINRAGKIAIFDVKGKGVFRWFVVTNEDGEIVLDVSSIPLGMYILKIETEDGSVFVGRFIKG